MTHHIWGDAWENWEDLYEAIQFIENYWKKYGRICVVGCKEKYGTFRDHSSFWDGTLYGLYMRGWYYYRWPKFCYKIDHKIIKRITHYTGILKLSHKWQAYIYNRGIHLALIRWPKVKDEILQDIQRYDLIKPGPGIDVGGKELKERYWISL